MADAYRFGPFSLDAARRVLFANGRTVPLAPKVVETLALLVRDAGQPVSKAALVDALWPDGFVEDGNLTQNVYLLRRTLREHGLENAIETLPKRGYRFTAAVTRVTEEAVSTYAGRPAARHRALTVAALIAACIMVAAIFVARPRAAAGMNAEDTRLYRLGQYFWNTRSIAGLHRSAAYFTIVAGHNRHNAPAHAALADAYLELYDYDCAPSDCARFAGLARTYASRAVSLAPEDPAALTADAMVKRVFDRDFSGSDAEFRRAIEIDPRYALAREWYGNSLLVRGRTAEAMRELHAAALLEPSATADYAWLARAAYFRREYASAITYAGEALALTPSRVETRILLGLALQQSGKPEEARRAFEVLSKSGNDARALIAATYDTRRNRSESEWLLRTGGNSADRALGYVKLHDLKRALAILKRVRFSNDVARAFLALDPRLDPVRNDSRFASWTRLPPA